MTVKNRFGAWVLARPWRRRRIVASTLLSRCTARGCRRATPTTAASGCRPASARSSPPTISAPRGTWRWRANGDLYVALMTSGGRGQPQTGGGAVALRDANSDGKFEVVERFGSGSTTGIAIRNGYVYLAHPQVDRALQAHRRQLKPAGAAETIVTGLSHRPAARGQGHRLRRPRRPLHQRRRALERLPESGSPAGREGRRSLPAAREARRHLEVRREQVEPDAGPGHALRHRPAPDARHHLARRRALHRDEQPRSARRVLAQPVHRRRTTPSGRPSRSTARCRGRTSAGRTATTTTPRR